MWYHDHTYLDDRENLEGTKAYAPTELVLVLECISICHYQVSLY